MDFFTDFYVGFASSPGEAVLVFAAILVFIGGLAGFFVVRSRREARERVRQAEEAYREHLEQFSLAPSDEDAIETMSRYLNAPERKYLLLVSQGIFNSCAERALEAEEVSEQQISALRVKLGFAGRQTTKPPASTTEIPSGSAVLLHQKGEYSVRGRVVEHEPTALLVELDEGAREFTYGSPVTVLHQTNAGIFAFESVVEGRDGVVLRLAHDEEPKRMQRRQYYRGQIDLPVYIRPTGSRKEPLQSRFIDVGGGGASIQNPSSKLGKGADLELTFHPDSDAPLNLHGRVVRTSEQGKVLHVKFEKLRESTRDKIFRLLFRAQQ
jgi:c-di-GMP-binding flagellar brake protein YcgR